MRNALVVVLLATLSVVASDAPKQAADGAEGKRAFDDLTAFYADTKKEPPYKPALTDLASTDAAKSKAASAYITALFKQLYADESNGRSPVKRSPFFGGGGTSSDARDFRAKLAAAFSKDAQGDGALDAALWLIDSEKDPRNQPAGMDALKRVKGPKSVEIFRKLLQQPHPNASVAKSVIEEVAARGLKELAPEITKLCVHFRTSVREAARDAAPKLGIAKIPDYKPEAAFSPWLEQELKNIAGMVVVEIPKDAKWMHFALSGNKGGKGEGEFSGYVLDEKDGTYHVVDYFGTERFLSKNATATGKTETGVTATPRTLAEEAKALLEVRAASNDLSSLSRMGMATAQFEPKFVSVPEALVAAWCFTHGDKASAAALLFPRIDATADDRWVGWVTRDLLGHQYFQKMLVAFSHARDFPATLALAKHLSKPVFDDYNYQERTKLLAEQLAKREDDFKKFALPEPAKWEELKKTLKRDEQIKFLAEHMRLLNCIQMGQPGDVNYADPQTAQPFSRGQGMVGQGTAVINPYNELTNMKLEVADMAILAPFLADENFIPTFSYWREFHSKRTLHQVNWVISTVLNEAAKRDLSEIGIYSNLDAEGKKKHIDKILDWCKTNAGKTRDQLPDERPKRNTGGARIDAP